MGFIELALFFAIPIVVFAWFIVSAIRYRKCPGDLMYEKKRLRTTMIITGIISFVFIVSAIVLVSLLFMAIRYM